MSDHLREALQTCIPFLWHDKVCDFASSFTKPCSCGYVKALEIARAALASEPVGGDEVSDGFGSTWRKCSRPSGCGLHVVRPGKVQCDCEYEASQPPVLVEEVKPLATRFFDEHHTYSLLRDKVENAVMSVLGLTEDTQDWPFDDFTFDWYDTSFELKECKPSDFDIKPEQYPAFKALGFSRCWLCFGNRGDENYKEKYHAF